MKFDVVGEHFQDTTFETVPDRDMEVWERVTVAANKMDTPSKGLDANTVASDDHIASLTRRVEALEKKLLGAERASRGCRPPLRATLASLEERLEGLARAGKTGGSVGEAWAKLDTLERLLSPEYESHARLSADSKAELLVGYSKKLAPLCSRADEIHQLKDYLNATEFQGLENLERRLANVARRHGEQEREVEGVSEEVRELLALYQRTVMQMSAQCVEWSELLSRLEAAR